MKECVDEGILQSYFDGELSIDVMEKVSSHLTGCLACKRAARELENESLLVSNALAPEFSMSVPSERLRARVDAAIAERHLLNPPRPVLQVSPNESSSRSWWENFAELFTIAPQRAFAYGGVAAVVLFALTFAIIKFQKAPVPNRSLVATTTGSNSTPPIATSSPSSTVPEIATPKIVKRPAPAVNNSKAPAVVAANYKSNPRQPGKAVEADHVKLLPGERSYLKTIAALDTSIKSDRNRPMRPALQSEYERNLAMVDRAIAATRNAAKSNPNDPEAAEFMFAAYQTKVDLLNQVAEARMPNRQQ
ncbi:MAG TPA: hypothetical protein VGN86_06920 [Pyrinomonadaceae bacterium]|nr:hypothetical protein [Pyrinomonadaceae bacterium]